MTTLLQTDAAPDRLTLSTPILLKVPIVLQPQIISKSYGCEVVVPILLKIPIALQIEILTKSLQCNTQKSNLKTALTESIQQTTEEILEPALKSLDTLLPSDLDIAKETRSRTKIDTKISLSQPKLRELRKPKLRLDPYCPMTVLAILLGIFLGVGCSSLLVNQLLKLEANQNRALTHATVTSPLHVIP